MCDAVRRGVVLICLGGEFFFFFLPHFCVYQRIIWVSLHPGSSDLPAYLACLNCLPLRGACLSLLIALVSKSCFCLLLSF